MSAVVMDPRSNCCRFKNIKISLTFDYVIRYDVMLHCWNEDPLQRPTFTELRDHLEEIMSQGCHYMSFDIDEKNVYYNVASYNLSLIHI